MQRFDHTKYPKIVTLNKPDRRWPNRTLEKAPMWCSVDLRDGNQALIDPMTPEQKMDMFDMLIDVGFKHIEVGFPAASQPDFDFVRKLITENRIPDDVTIQVLTQARKELIVRTYEALKGVKKAIVHVYNSTSTTQREQVFKKSKEEIKHIAVEGAAWVKEFAARQPETQWQFQYSPESFTGTEIDYAIDVCDAVIDVWQATPDNKVIINLPATVEVAPPNVYADQIEWFCDNVKKRDSIIVSLHTHNDRGCGVAASELGILAGADRVEGTLLGNGERTGNMDIVTMGMNYYSRGVDPELDFSAMDKIINVVEKCTALPVHPRHPYAGELVFAAFSGSHQDAINKCLANQNDGDMWDVAYLPIDPRDVGRNYQEVIRINSQSGKGGVTYVLEQEHGIKMPRWLQIDFSPVVQKEAERTEAEVNAEQIFALFNKTYLNANQSRSLIKYEVKREDGIDVLSAVLVENGKEHHLSGKGSGVLEAFVSAMSAHTGKPFVIINYNEHTLGTDESAEAMAYVQISIDQKRVCGAGKSQDILGAILSAILNAVAFE
ncbi:2-isopropylmalate synthase [Alteromonas sp. 5E99-2]|uniref:2-isopropylmalate synthase n=1 Tax=Alteromonas sp. 5E99-2 TaxID=2817683 RepID=UPI001A98AFAE|nr:2-isopropylmalate synthase [Alteromonas sp. 5E99-2]MBO1256867.1 2-isopropylmalate synthase [Alteromonas sp. 5E99-2]